MPLIFEIECPKCQTRYQVTKMIWDEGPQALMYCPVCMNRFPRKDGKIISANFPVETASPAK